MKRLMWLLALLPVFILSAGVFAADSNTFYVNNAYFKGDGKYDVVVYSSNKDTLKLYINDKNPIKAKVNKDGWATFKKVKLSEQSKLSFAKKVGFVKYAPVDYVKYIQVDIDKVKLYDTGPKHSYEEFSKWLGDTMQYTKPLDIMQFPQTTSRFNLIRMKCGISKDFNDAKWISCMQESYKEYLKPESFVGQSNQFESLELIGTVDGVNSFGMKYTTQDTVNAATATYNKFAVTNY